MMKLLQHIIIGLLIFLLLINFSCKKEEDSPEVTNKIEIGITNIDTISYYTSTTSTILISTGGNQITQHGHCWSIDKEPTIEDNHTKLGSKNDAGKFISELDSLEPTTEYYVRAYTSYALGTVYGEIKEFETINTGKPVVTTSEVQNITLFAAECGGVVVNDSGLVVTARGVCWNTTDSPTLDDCISFTSDSIGTGNFTSLVNNLLEGTNYYIAAYATNEKGTSYGEVKSFITIPIVIPEVVTGDITNIFTNNAQCSGNVLSDGNGTITARGICWNTTDDFDLENCLGFTDNGTGLGEFTGNITELTYGTIYFTKAYATNEKGIAYGEVKSFETVEIGLPVLTTMEVTNITTNSAQCGGTITDAGNGNVVARGVCWSTSNDPTLDDCIGFTTNGNGIGSFTSNITELIDGTEYYVRAFATNEEGTSYGETKIFSTIEIVIPTVATFNVTNITYSTAECGGNVSDDGYGTVTARGICWSTNDTPTLENCIDFTTDGDGLGNFISSMTNLSSGFDYFVCAYATNEKGTAYGDIKTFQTISGLPVVATGNVTDITTNSAQCGGIVSDEGNGTVTVKGVCWSTENNPSLGNCIGFTNDGSGMGSYSSDITELDPGIDYYVVAYAINEVGTGYGQIRHFTTIDVTLPSVITYEATEITTTSAISGGEVTDDGNGTISVRGVCWSTSENPTLDDYFTTDGSGTGSFISQLTDLSPNTNYYVRAYATNEAGTSYGNQVSFKTITPPTVITTEAYDITPYTATSGGNVTNDGGGTVSVRGVCWSILENPTLEDPHTVDGSGMGNFISELSGLTPNTTYYIRAYANNEAGTAYGNQISFTTITDILPSVTTNEVSNITQNSATSGGNVTSNGGGTVSARGVCWSASINPTLDDPHTSDGSGMGSFTSEITGLNPNSNYYVRAYATNEAGTAYGYEIELLTDFENCGEISYEGETYLTVVIGSQCWFRKNLNIGLKINGIEGQIDNEIVEKYCYDDLESNCDEYGGLYQWDEAMEYTIIQGAQGICPTGWHIPTDSEWEELVDYLGGEEVAGGEMKETGYVHWNSPNTGATNSSGFTGLPGGFRHTTSGSFFNLGNIGVFWSSSVFNASRWCRNLSHGSDNVGRETQGVQHGISVRCLQD